MLRLVRRSRSGILPPPDRAMTMPVLKILFLCALGRHWACEDAVVVVVVRLVTGVMVLNPWTVTTCLLSSPRLRNRRLWWAFIRRPYRWDLGVRAFVGRDFQFCV